MFHSRGDASIDSAVDIETDVAVANDTPVNTNLLLLYAASAAALIAAAVINTSESHFGDSATTAAPIY